MQCLYFQLKSHNNARVTFVTVSFQVKRDEVVAGSEYWWVFKSLWLCTSKTRTVLCLCFWMGRLVQCTFPPPHFNQWKKSCKKGCFTISNVMIKWRQCRKVQFFICEKYRVLLSTIFSFICSSHPVFIFAHGILLVSSIDAACIYLIPSLT